MTEIIQLIEVFFKIKLPCLSNLSVCHLKLKNYKKSIKYSDKVLEIDLSNIKAYYRRALSNFE